jgi:hypothetical protein
MGGHSTATGNLRLQRSTGFTTVVSGSQRFNKLSIMDVEITRYLFSSLFVFRGILATKARRVGGGDGESNGESSLHVCFFVVVVVCGLSCFLLLCESAFLFSASFFFRLPSSSFLRWTLLLSTYFIFMFPFFCFKYLVVVSNVKMEKNCQQRDVLLGRCR